MVDSSVDPLFVKYVQEVKQDLLRYSAELNLAYEVAQKDRNFDENDFLNRKQSEFTRFFDDRVEVLKGHAIHLSPSDCVAEGAFLRRECRGLIAQAPFINRTTSKPRGYQGDSEMMRMVYENGWQGESVFGKLLHKYGVSSPSAEAVRNRRSLITDESCGLLDRHDIEHPLRLLSVACGPANEVADIFSKLVDSRLIEITLLDQDPEALAEAEMHILQAGKVHGCHINAKYVKRSIGTLLKPEIAVKLLGQFDFIYSMGLYDYLDRRTATALTTSLFGLLAPGGTLLLGNYAKASQVDAIRMQYWCDWPLLYRSEDEFRDLVRPGLADHVIVATEPSGTQMFLRARKIGLKAVEKL